MAIPFRPLRLPIGQLYSLGLVSQSDLFSALFSPTAFVDAFNSHFINSRGKGTDRLNGFQFAKHSSDQLTIAASKCVNGRYRFAPYLENLKVKGRNKIPRLIGVPIIRDRVVLHQLNKFLATVYPDCVPRTIASTYVRTIAEHLPSVPADSTWVCGLDIKTFYDSIHRDRLLALLTKRIQCRQALSLIEHALVTPTVPQNTARWLHGEYRTPSGVPQGLAISNILASIYMKEVDDAMNEMEVVYYRYVDDVLMYGAEEKVLKAYKSLGARLRLRGLALHPLRSEKTHLALLREPFDYLGYSFYWPKITVRNSTVERFLQTIAAKFSHYMHNKALRLERFKYLTEERIAEIFLLELNERITGAISERKRYGWVAYFSQITDLSLLHRLDRSIAGMFSRIPDFGYEAPAGLRKLSRAYFEMKFNPVGRYVRNYDTIITRAEKLEFLDERGLVGPEEALTDEQINDRYDRYRKRILSEMQADEGILYG